MQQFLDLGRQPIANGFISPEWIADEYFYNLRVGYDPETYLVSLLPISPDKEQLFHVNYSYRTGMSETMRRHFRHVADILKCYNPVSILEIGSNDGTFLQHFDSRTVMSVEPCRNFAGETRKKGYYTICEFWNEKTAEAILAYRGKMDFVYAANCMCHISDVVAAFKNVAKVLDDGGFFVFEDPSLLEMFRRKSYDQIYDEHVNVFSVFALTKLLNDAGLHLCKVDHLSHIHGGSNRIWAQKSSSNIDYSVSDCLVEEVDEMLNSPWTYTRFAESVARSKRKLRDKLIQYKNDNKRIIGYGATSKSTVVYNYCGIGPEIIDCVVDSTLEKQNLNIPGVHIPIVSRKSVDMSTVDYAFLGAWNFEKEICEKEKEWLNNGGRFITHVPDTREIKYDTT